jgi:hypothetical protein
MMPAIASREPRSKRGANRQYSAILRAYKRAFDGGGAFEWDWPTLRSNWPEGYAKLQTLKSVYYTLPN